MDGMGNSHAVWNIFPSSTRCMALTSLQKRKKGFAAAAGKGKTRREQSGGFHRIREGTIGSMRQRRAGARCKSLLSGRVGFEGVVCASPFVSTLKPPDDMTYFFSSLVPLLSTLTGPCFASPGALFDFNGGGVAPAGGLFLLPSVTLTGFFPLPCRSSLVCADVHAISAMTRRMMVVHFDISLPLNSGLIQPRSMILSIPSLLNTSLIGCNLRRLHY